MPRRAPARCGRRRRTCGSPDRRVRGGRARRSAAALERAHRRHGDVGPRPERPGSSAS
jgi:hypothetical protein